jgi:hypothetical protein
VVCMYVCMCNFCMYVCEVKFAHHLERYLCMNVCMCMYVSVRSLCAAGWYELLSGMYM